MLEAPCVVVKGGGDIASGVVHRLHRARMRVVVTELARPRMIRRPVSFGSAVYEGEVEVEGVVARVTGEGEAIGALLDRGIVPVIVASKWDPIQRLKPQVVVDGIMAKRNLGTQVGDAPVVIGVGPGFVAGMDVDAVIETMRGHYLGRVITEGSALADTGGPGAIEGHTLDRVLWAPCAGRFRAVARIGDRVRAGDVVAEVGDEPLRSRIDGVVRGMLYAGLAVQEGQKVGDVDPRGEVDHCFTISDKARAVGGGVLEAILSLLPQAGEQGSKFQRRRECASD